MNQPFIKGQNSEVITVRGKVSWVRCVSPNKFGKWSVTLHPDKDSLDKIRDLQAEGMKNVVKKDDDGYFVQFSRPTELELRKGFKQGVTPPTIVSQDGKPLEGVAVGNGSDAVVMLEVYSHPVPNTDKRAKAARLMGLKIENLVPFNPQNDYQDTEVSGAVQKALDVPQPMW